MVGQAKVVEDFGLAQVHSDQHSLLAGQGENGGDIGGDKGLAFPGDGRGHQNHLLFLTRVDVLHVGTQGAKGLRNHRFGMLQSHQGGRLVVVPNHPQDRDLGPSFHFGTINQGILQAIPDQDHRDRNQQTQ